MVVGIQKNKTGKYFKGEIYSFHLELENRRLEAKTMPCQQ